jgi:hypothetical protein
MTKYSQNLRNSAKLLGAICGGFIISLSAIPQATIAQQIRYTTTSKVNPCPKIFYEKPHDNQVLVPQGCPPNAFTRRYAAQGLTPLGNVPATPSTDQTNLGVGGESPYGQTAVPTMPNIQPGIVSIPLPEQRQAPNARIALNNGMVNVRLVNETGADITYQVIGDTAPRSLGGKSDVMLQGLSAPTTVTFQRRDGGLLSVNVQPSSQTGMLEVTLDETTDLRIDTKALRIENNGSVFLN